MQKLVPGVNHISNRDYHADLGWLSSSSFKKIVEDPAKFYQENVLGVREPEEEKGYLVEGSLTHSLVLEPHLVATEYARFPGLRKQGAEWEAFKAANSHLQIVSKPQFERAQAFYRAYKANKVAVSLIEQGGLSEHTVAHPLDGVPCKVRADRINLDKGFILDIKTSSFSVDPDGAKQTVMHWSYEMSAAFYCAVFESYYGRPFEWYWCFISKTDLDCQVYKMSYETRRKGQKMFKDGMDLYKQCLATGLWTKKQEVEEVQSEEILEI